MKISPSHQKSETEANTERNKEIQGYIENDIAVDSTINR